MPKKAESTAALRLKLVIRRLPPTLPEALFWQSVSRWVEDDRCVWKRYVKGRPVVQPGDHPVHSRAYCLMASVESLVEFHRGFDGHVFRSKTGIEHQAVVEYAPVQKTPNKAKLKADARQGTIDEDADFKSFLQSLTAPLEPAKPIEPTPHAPQSDTTPLIEHLRAHGPLRKKGKSKSDTSASDLARNATASINAAASKRTSKDTGPVFAAGKGRETMAVDVPPSKGSAPKANGQGSAEKTDKSKKRNEKGGQVKKGDSSSGKDKDGMAQAVASGGKGKDANKKGKGKKEGNKGAGAAGPPVSSMTPASFPTLASSAVIASGRSTPTGRNTPTPAGPSSAQTLAPDSLAPEGSSTRGASGRGRGRGGAIIQGNGAAQRTRNQITDILTKNAHADATAGAGQAGKGRGGGGGRGGRGGRGNASEDGHRSAAGTAAAVKKPPTQPRILARGAPPPDPRNARIDS